MLADPPRGPTVDRRRRPTLKEVARLVGVDASTVSRALVGDQRVTDETRRRITKVASDLGYRPNGIARRLRTARTQTIALMVPDLGNLGFADITRGAQAAATEADYLLLVAEAPTRERRDALFSTFGLEGLVDGLLIAFAQNDDPSLVPLMESHVPLVLVNRRILRPDTSGSGSVIVDDDWASRLVVEHLVELGHTDIAHVTGALDTDTGLRRQRGFLQALGEHNLRLDAAWMATGDFTERRGYEAARRLLDVPHEHRPTAIFAGNLMSSLGVLDAIRDAGLTVPIDISLITIDDHLVAAHTNPPMTTVRMPFHKMGVESVRMLLRRINGEAMTQHVVLDAPELIVRASTARPSA